jgi:4-hydroxy-3-polyprenylbenzoate decarboxylase
VTDDSVQNPKSQIRNPKSQIIDIHNYAALAKIFAGNFDPGYSLHFSKGPLDILDHSSQKYAYGSKLGIDLTRPFAEEIQSGKDTNPEISASPLKIPIVINVKGVPNVISFKSLFETHSLPVLLLTILKDETFSKKELEKELVNLPEAKQLKVVLLFDDGVDLNDLFSLMWLLGGNLEPDRDISILNTPSGNTFILVDATFKTLQHDQFRRDWPNIVTMDNQTIAAIDNMWKELGLGEFLESPSLKYKLLVKGVGATFKV